MPEKYKEGNPCGGCVSLVSERIFNRALSCVSLASRQNELLKGINIFLGLSLNVDLFDHTVKLLLQLFDMRLKSTLTLKCLDFEQKVLWAFMTNHCDHKDQLYDVESNR